MGPHLDRRQWLLAASAMLAPSVARLQPVHKVFRIGVLMLYTPPGNFLLDLLYDALNDLGYEAGRNIAFEHRYAEDREDRLSALAADLVARKVDLIVVGSNEEALAANRATQTIPIVMWWGYMPVESGLVASLGRPGGNLTGVSYDPEAAGRKLEILRETVPRAARVAFLWDPERRELNAHRQAAAKTAEALGIRLTVLPVSSLRDLEAAFDRIAQDRPDALFVMSRGQLWTHRARVIEFAARQRLPAIYGDKSRVLEGGLMSHWEDVDASAHQLAAIADRIIKGERPAEIAVEHPKRFVVTVNLKTAKAMGFSFPPSFLAKADEVIH
jgi:putative tryptophan/tyrosine transport system substrate-binding protein